MAPKKTKASAPKVGLPLSPMQAFRAEEKAARGIFTKLTTDSFENFAARLGLNNDNTFSAGTYEFNLVTRNRIKLEAAYRGSWLVGVIIDSIAEDMTRAGINPTLANDDGQIKKFQAEFSRRQVWQSLCSLVKWGRMYGGAIGVLQIEGQDLASPLDVDTVGINQFKGISVYDRWMLNPTLFETIRSGPDIGLPKFYQIVTPNSAGLDAPTMTGSIRVHHSRCTRYIGIELPFFQAITEQMWGESVLERLWDRMIAFDTATLSSANLIERASNRMVGIEKLRDVIAMGGDAMKALLSQFDLMRSMMTNEGITLLDKADEYKADTYTFAGLAEMLLQFGQQLAGASGIPMVRLFGQSPAGLSATGESDIRMYYDSINAQQEARLRNPMQTLCEVVWRSKFGEALPDDFEFEFTPLWQESATEKATNNKTTTETIVGVYEGGLRDRAQTLKELQQKAGETGLFGTITDDEIADAEAEADEPPMPTIPGLPATGAGSSVPGAGIQPGGLDPAAKDPKTDPATKPVPSFDGKPRPTPIWAVDRGALPFRTIQKPIV